MLLKHVDRLGVLLGFSQEQYTLDALDTELVSLDASHPWSTVERAIEAAREGQSSVVNNLLVDELGKRMGSEVTAYYEHLLSLLNQVSRYVVFPQGELLFVDVFGFDKQGAPMKLALVLRKEENQWKIEDAVRGDI